MTIVSANELLSLKWLILCCVNLSSLTTTKNTYIYFKMNQKIKDDREAWDGKGWGGGGPRGKGYRYSYD